MAALPAIAFLLLFAPAVPAEAAFDKAASALSSQDYVAAEQGFLAVLKADPRSIPALGNLGVVYSRTNRYAQAIGVYQRALRIAPGHSGLLLNLGLAYVKQEQYVAALPLFQKLTASEPSNLQARELLATCQVALRKNEAALATLEDLRKNEPNEPGVLYMLGVTLTRVKRTEEAHDAFTRMMGAVNTAQGNFLMGKASYDTQRFEEAADFYRKALAADPSLAGVHRELGKTLISLHSDDEAEKELRAAGPDDAEAIYFLGGLLSQPRPAEAIPLLERSRKLSPDFWGPLYYLGRIYVDSDRAREALPLLDRAAKLNPGESSVQYQLGRTLQKLGRAAEARAAFARVKALKEQSLDKEVNALKPMGKP